MEYLIIGTTAFLTAGLTLFSGFGLGTLLMPVFAIFFPIQTAIALTAIVHLANNLFKFSIFARHTDKSVLFHFGLPAVFAAFFGARLLLKLSELDPLYAYSLAGHTFEISPVKAVIAVLIAAFVLLESLTPLRNVTFEKRWLPWGGALSGFFGGLSGNQGALRSAFLVRSGLAKESFIATGVAIACFVDLSRISVYSVHFLTAPWKNQIYLLIAATVSAFLGSWMASRFLKKITIRQIQVLVAVLLLGIAAGLGLGWI